MRTYILDGYNLIHRMKGLRAELDQGLEAARARLEARCLPLLRRKDVRAVFVVYDGRQEAEERRPSGLRIIYTRGKESADSRILRLVREEEGRAGECIIVTDDREVGWHGKGLGGRVIGCAELEALLEGEGRRASGSGGSGNKSPSGHAPKEGLKTSDCKRITDEYRKQLGL
ncbi:MAG: hypothetical protein MOGMAGMI_00545 [Candidatus Omnitrophica bacterium]|nr:hypothetical protein [Candidatus Omnitrophota bacterium]